MANKYYIWKDLNCNGTKPDWIEISGTQFFALGKDKTQKRYFKRIDDGVEDGADVLIMETTYEEYKYWHKKHDNRTDDNVCCFNICYVSITRLYISYKFFLEYY